MARDALAAAQCADPSNEAVWLGHGLINETMGPQGVPNAVAAYLSAVELRASTDALLAAAFSQLNLFPGVPAQSSEATIAAGARTAVDFAKRGVQGNGRDPAALLVLGLALERGWRWAQAAEAFSAAAACVGSLESLGVVEPAAAAEAKSKIAANLGRCLAKVRVCVPVRLCACACACACVRVCDGTPPFGRGM